MLMLFLRKFSSRTSGPFWAKNVKTCFFTYEAVHFRLKSEKVSKVKQGLLHVFTIFLQTTCEGVYFLVTF